MNARSRFILAIAILALLVSGPFFVTAAVVWADMQDLERELLISLLQPRLPLGVMFTAFAFIAGVIVVRTLFRQYVQGLLRMAEQLRLMLGANRNFRVALAGPPEVQRLAEAANDLAQQRDELLTDVAAQIARAKASVEEEKNRLAALMSELSQSVVVCNLDGRILLYNTRARVQFQALAQGPTSAVGSGTLIGLGRSIFTIFERNQIAHALEKILQRLQKGGAEPVANFVTTTGAGHLLRIQMAPVMGSPGQDGGADGGPQIAGYVLTMENITRAFEQETRRDQMLNSLTEGGRSSLASIRAAVENLIDYPDMEGEQRDRFVRIIGDEVKAMSGRLDQTMNEYADSLKTRWPLEEMLGVDLIAAAERRIQTKLDLPTRTEELDEALWVKVDSFSLLQALTFLAGRLKDDYEVREVRFRLSSEGRLAYFDLIWQGPPVSSETIHSWEIEPMNVAGETTPLTLRDVTERHGGEIWFQREKTRHRTFFRIVVPVANPQELPAAAAAALPRTDSRPEYYDFDLFNFRETSEELLDRKLSELAYTVFDTETTGLQPSAGDEIIQIGAARVLNGRLLSTETFEQLVDPQRLLPAASVEIHGITEDLLHGQPTIDTVLPAFHEFARDTVLVAHNAAFDMRFLQLKEAATGVRFTQPVLDTLLLSAVVHPNQETHKLEAIAERMGIKVIGRHTALGDAFVTGEIFLKMIPLLAEAGITTLRDALAASEKTFLARVKY